MQYKVGNPCMQGCNIVDGGYNFAYASTNASLYSDIKAYVCIFEKDSSECRYELELKKSMGTVYTLFLSDINIDDCLYCFKENGQYIVDPYAKAVTGCAVFGGEAENVVHLSPVKLSDYDWEGDEPLHIPYDECIMYKLNVRGYTKSKSSKVKAKGTFAGITEKADYLKELGVTTIELMPAYEYDEMGRFMQFTAASAVPRYNYMQAKGYAHSNLKRDERINCWGYTKGFYFAPKAAYSECAKAVQYTDYTTEFKDMVKCLHSKGIEVVMEFFFKDVDTSYITDCVRYWVKEYHIDGVHIYGDDVSLNALATDALLADTKIMTIRWNGAKGVYRHMASYNNDVQNIIRRYLKGDENMLGAFAEMQLNNPDNAAVINYVTTNNGFTLYDLVSYDRKHNELNGENNRDGENFNYSWNCGEEGATRKLKVRQLRIRQIKNALAMVILAQGTPLILAGDECANSQQGNNNPYCIDNEISWVNWKNNNDATEIYEWTKFLIDLRKKYGILHSKYRLTQGDSLSYGYPDVSFHGLNAWYADMDNYYRQIGIMYSESYADKGSRELIYIAYNMHWESCSLALPKIEGDNGFKVAAMTDSTPGSVCIDSEARKVTIPPRSMAVLTGEYQERKKPSDVAAVGKQAKDENVKIECPKVKM